jgi:hypothetical protein
MSFHHYHALFPDVLPALFSSRRLLWGWQGSGMTIAHGFARNLKLSSAALWSEWRPLGAFKEIAWISI